MAESLVGCKLSGLLCSMCLWVMMKLLWIYKQCLMELSWCYHAIRSCSITIDNNLKNQMTRIPKHMALCIGIDDCQCLDLDKLLQIIGWCDAFGVETLTIYHYAPLLMDENGGHLINNMMQSKQGQIQVKLISLQSSHQSVIETARAICNGNLSNGQYEPITVDQMDSLLRSSSYQMPDPELLICFSGQWTLQAFPPWQIRLTEIIFLPSHRFMNESLFVQQIKRYSKCVQRFGK